jgi:hypothetical protein
MVVMMPLVQLEDRLPGVEVMADEQARLLELRQHPIDRGEPDVRAFGEQLPVDVFGREVPHLRRLEDRDDLEPRHRGLEPGVLQFFRRGDVGEATMKVGRRSGGKYCRAAARRMRRATRASTERRSARRL